MRMQKGRAALRGVTELSVASLASKLWHPGEACLHSQWLGAGGAARGSCQSTRGVRCVTSKIFIVHGSNNITSKSS